jgi:hypothetical protein
VYQLARATVDSTLLHVAFPVGELEPETQLRIQDLPQPDLTGVVVVVSDSTGRAAAKLLADGDRKLAALAVAAVLASWKWDESESFQVVVDDLVFSITLEFNSRTNIWAGQVTRYE